ncbi:MAG: DUF2141 domain-containing protein [Bacteroidota bacterium]|jgi:uncharacterized protein (DUF2141 family)
MTRHQRTSLAFCIFLTGLFIAAGTALQAQGDRAGNRQGNAVNPSAKTEKLGSITVRISGIEDYKGKLMIGLYDNAEEFPDDGGQARGGAVRVTGPVHSYTFTDVPYGTWAIAVLHDSNENGEMDLNWLGMPDEGYAFSNNATAFFSAPDFEDARFVVNGDITVKITIKY